MLASRTSLGFSLVLFGALSTLTASACGSTPADPIVVPDGGPPRVPAPPAPTGSSAEAGTPDAGVLQGLPPPEKPKPDEYTEAFGVFVATSGAPEAAGTRAAPLSTISAGILKAKLEKKRLYVCAGTYPEPLVLEDGVSIVANLDCFSPQWKEGLSHAVLASPSSPAVTARNIRSATRVDGLDVIAPAGTEAEPSSIGLLAVDSVGLTLSGGKVEAQAGFAGKDGVPLPGYTLRADRAAEPSRAGSQCLSGIGAGSPCSVPQNAGEVPFNARPQNGVAQGGLASCIAEGAATLSGTGGNGGNGRLYDTSGTAVVFPQTLGTPGSPSTPAQPVGGASSLGGAFNGEGYTTGDGQQGNHALTMSIGGAGGMGGTEFTTPGALRYSSSGSAGGAGGCPGRYGSGGKGGGASVAALLTRSPVRFEKSALRAGNGGSGGAGSYGASPTLGQPGAPAALGGLAGADGAAGVQAGASGHGAGGPSFGIVHDSAGKPTLADSPITHGAAGASPGITTTPSVFGQPARTIPAAGIAGAANVLEL